LPVLYCDASLYVLNKPAGLPVHPVSRYVQGTVVGRLRERLGAGFAAPVHRLDRETSGVLLCARTRRMAAMLTKLFLEGGIKKEYLAICQGAAAAQSFSVDAPIGQGGQLVRIGVHIAAAGTGQAAQTAFWLQHSFNKNGAPHTVWRAQPSTGRRHQIRAHLRHAGLPLVGDKIYGASEALYDRFCAHRLTQDDWRTLQMPRHALHAWRLSFRHPDTQQSICFEAPLPDDMVAFVQHAAPEQMLKASWL
jgi:23S rRNA pseudouridine1911/1915/1917 synthase